MRIQDVMTTDVISISPDAPVATAREQLRLNEIHHLVVMEAKRIVGIISDRDLSGRNDQTRVGDVMTREVATISPSATLRKAAGMLEGRTIGCLPVVRNGKVEGIVTTSDLLRALAKGAIHPTPDSERFILRRRGPAKRRARI